MYADWLTNRFIDRLNDNVPIRLSCPYQYYLVRSLGGMHTHFANICPPVKYNSNISPIITPLPVINYNQTSQTSSIK